MKGNVDRRRVEGGSSKLEEGRRNGVNWKKGGMKRRGMGEKQERRKEEIRKTYQGQLRMALLHTEYI